MMYKRKRIEIMKVDKRPEMIFPEETKENNIFLANASKIFDQLKEQLYELPSFVNLIKQSIPMDQLVPVLTGEQQKQIKKGALKFMAKKDGTFLGILVNPETNEIVANVPLKEIKKVREIAPALNDLAVQMQLSQLSVQMKELQNTMNRIEKGLEYDRLASAYSNKRKLIQARLIRNKELQTQALLQIAHATEDSRGRLMLGMHENIRFIVEQPEDLIGKVLTNQDEVNRKMGEIRSRIIAINDDSLTEAAAYWELGEKEAAMLSIDNYRLFLEEAGLTQVEVLDQLDLIDPSSENYWTKSFPVIKETVSKLTTENRQLLGGNYGE